MPRISSFFFFFFNDTATTEIYTLSLHDALPILSDGKVLPRWLATGGLAAGAVAMALALVFREDTKADQAAFVLPVLWQLVTGAVGLLLSARPETDDAAGPAVRRVGTA